MSVEGQNRKSSMRANVFRFTPAGSTGRRNTGVKSLCWGAVVRQRRLQIMPTLVAAYRDWGRLLTAMRAIILSAFLILLAISVAEEFVPKGLSEQQLSGEALGL